MRTTILYVLMLFISQHTIFAQEAKESNSNFPILKGKYLGQKPPGITSEIFAPGIVSTEMHEHSFPSFSEDANQIFWTSIFIDNYAYEFPVKIIESNNYLGKWSEPDFFSAISLTQSSEAFISPDGRRIYFTSTIEQSEWGIGMGKQDIWYIEKSDSGWSTPKNLGFPINTNNAETKPTVTSKLTLYYVGHADSVKNNYGIYRSDLVDGNYQKPELLPKSINSMYLDWTPFIAPDESYILFASFRPGGYGNGDLYISFMNKDKSWSEPMNLGENINGAGNERYPYVSPDGKYLFFVSDIVDKELTENSVKTLKHYKEKFNNYGNGWCDIYWVNTKFIETLKPTEMND